MDDQIGLELGRRRRDGWKRPGRGIVAGLKRAALDAATGVAQHQYAIGRGDRQRQNATSPMDAWTAPAGIGAPQVSGKGAVRGRAHRHGGIALVAFQGRTGRHRW